jgi:hypothetical protein
MMVAEDTANNRGVAALATNFMKRLEGEVNALEDWMPMSMALTKAKSVRSIVLPAVGTPPSVAGGLIIIALAGSGGIPGGSLLSRLLVASTPFLDVGRSAPLSTKPDNFASVLVDELLISRKLRDAEIRAAKNLAIVLQYSMRKPVPSLRDPWLQERST